MPYTSDDFVTEVRRRSRLPTATDISDAEILQYGDQEMQSTFADVIRNVDASFWLTTKTFAVASGTALYRIPRRAFGVGVERIELRDSAGNAEPVEPINAHDTWRYSGGGRGMWRGRCGYVLEGEYLRILPTPRASEAGLTLAVYYQMEPSRLVLTTACALVDQSAVTATTIGVDETDNAEIITAGSVIDVVRGIGTHVPVATDLVVSSYDTPTDVITLSGTTPLPAAQYDASTSSLPGDYVCAAGTSPYPAIPTNLWPALVSATARDILMGLGDGQGASMLAAETEQRLKSAISTTTPRSRQTPVFLNHGSYLRRGRGRR